MLRLSDLGHQVGLGLTSTALKIPVTLSACGRVLVGGAILLPTNNQRLQRLGVLASLDGWEAVRSLNGPCQGILLTCCLDQGMEPPDGLTFYEVSGHSEIL